MNTPQASQVGENASCPGITVPNPPPGTSPSGQFEAWAIVELMGRQKIAGKVSEATIAGGNFLRVDVPNENGSTDYTRFYSPSAVYAISPVASQIAIGWCVRNKPEPVTAYDLTKLARQPSLPWNENEGEEDGED